ncbi:MAG: N-acetylglucosamine-6-phosphate deacetylase [Butyrivibrio sp.]|nr:N-acetylglucosamine-6-phosphate deacetylase [Butyrivibrio sp.]
MIIKNGKVYTREFAFKEMNIRTDGDRISEVTEDEISPADDEEVVDAEGLYVIPGLTDLHFHGAAGADICDATEDAIRKLAEYEYSVGVTQICPATMTLPADRISDICEVAHKYERASKDEAELVGINLEGPYISPKKVGAQNPDFVQKADVEFLRKLIEKTEHLPKLITIAPEITENLECIKALAKEIRFSVGHTMADYNEAVMGFEAGARHMTHLYNAMPGLNHREPGPIAAGAERDDVTAEIICDGIHIAPGAIRAAFKLFGAERMILISDSTRATGLPDGEYELGGQKVYKHHSAAYLLPGETENNTLAGSCTNLFGCMLKAMEFGISAEDAIRAATYNPAKALGILESYGSVEVGKRANLLLLDKNYKLLRVL